MSVCELYLKHFSAIEFNYEFSTVMEYRTRLEHLQNTNCMHEYCNTADIRSFFFIEQNV